MKKKNIIIKLFIILLFNLNYYVFSQLETQFILLTIENKKYEGIIKNVKNNELTFFIKEKKKNINIPLEDIVEVVNKDIINKLQKKIKKKKEDYVYILLNDNSLIKGTIEEGNYEYILLFNHYYGNIKIDLLKIKEIWFKEYNSTQDDVSSSEENDIVYLKNGDIIKGMIQNISKSFIEIEHSDLGIIRKEFKDIERVKFAQLEDINKNQNNSLTKTIIIGKDNSILKGEILEISKSTVKFKIISLNKELEFPTKNVKFMFFKGNKIVYISDLPKNKIEIKYIPFFPTIKDIFMPKFDKNQRGNPIILNGREYYKGIGMTSHTILKVKLEKKYKYFQAMIGIDDEVKKVYKKYYYRFIGGSVIFRVYLDNKKVYESKIMKWDTPPKAINIDVQNRDILTLEVDFAKGEIEGNLNDVADWGGARLILK